MFFHRARRMERVLDAVRDFRQEAAVIAARLDLAERLILELLAWAPPEEQARITAEWEASK
ncbi:hypothetical protein [Paracoccus sulfuroxidans]|uniref:Uncharacterized protein n=1 Tax=Paracoccus sulfuroxidans TaxID=384678 RepID=A0A562NKM9_9RHOB|nr:hypothetical protein [Paracoccus sulfuroxidans]TWI32769.1 hypothetical protein IQ24_02644 [Paracoccus sulfuroxidans]